jgi:hypothetical protein
MPRSRANRLALPDVGEATATTSASGTNFLNSVRVNVGHEARPDDAEFDGHGMILFAPSS